MFQTVRITDSMQRKLDEVWNAVGRRLDAASGLVNVLPCVLSNTISTRVRSLNTLFCVAAK